VEAATPAVCEEEVGGGEAAAKADKAVNTNRGREINNDE